MFRDRFRKRLSSTPRKAEEPLRSIQPSQESRSIQETGLQAVHRANADAATTTMKEWPSNVRTSLMLLTSLNILRQFYVPEMYMSRLLFLHSQLNRFHPGVSTFAKLKVHTR